MIGPFLVAWVADQPDIVGEIAARFRPQEEAVTGTTFPYVTYFVVSDNTGMTLGGSSGLAQKRVQLDFMAKSYAEVDRLALLFKGTKESPRLNGYRGTLGGVEVKACFVRERQDLYETSETGDGLGTHRVTMDLEIWHRE